jgi:hypothetical protein
MSDLAGISDTDLRRELEHRVDLSPHTLMAGLSLDAVAIDAASERLAQRVKQFEGVVKADGEIELGVKLRWDAAIDGALIDLEREMLEHAADPANVLPAALKSRASKAMEAEARVRVKTQQPGLWVEYAELEADVRALNIWIRAKERSSSLRQSILSAQKQGSTLS